MNSCLMVLLGLLFVFYPTNTTPPKTSWEHYHLYMWAQFNQLEKKFDIAQQCYQIILSTAPLYSYIGFLNFLFQTKQFDRIVVLIPTLESTIQERMDSQLLLAQSFQQLNQNKKADDILIAINKKHPENNEALFHVLNSYMRSNRYDEALKLINDHLIINDDVNRKNFIFYSIQAQIYMYLNNYKSALESAQKAVELQPMFDQGWLLCAVIQEILGNYEQAIKAYKTYNAMSGPNPTIEQQIAQLTLKHEQSIILKKPTIIHDPIQQLIKEKKFNEAIQSLEEIINKNSSNLADKLLLLELLSITQNSLQLLQQLLRWINQDPRQTIWLNTLYFFYHTQPNKLLIKKTFIALSLNVAQARLYCADIFLKEGDINQAIYYLQQALNDESDAYIRTTIFYQLALCYYQKKEWLLMYTVLEKGRQEYQHYPPLLNLLAYYYATRTSNYTKAQEFISASLRIEPLNSYYLDTQAVIWYKQGNFDQAEKILKVLIQSNPKEFLMAKHYAKTLYKKGYKENAINALEYALQLTKHNIQKQKIVSLLAQWKSA